MTAPQSARPRPALRRPGGFAAAPSSLARYGLAENPDAQTVRRQRQPPAPSGWSWGTAIVVTVVVAVAAGAVVLWGYLPARPRVLVYGDSLMVQSQGVLRADAVAAGSHAVDLRTLGGTAPCDWTGDVRTQLRDFRPTVAVIGFSGNLSDCMAGRDLVTGYRADVTEMLDQFAAAGVPVRLVEEPARSNELVDAFGRTALGVLWERIATERPGIQVVRADLAVTDNGRFSWTLPCESTEPCDPDGRIVVRAPDGVHFCLHDTVPDGTCADYASGARRYGDAIARGVFG